ncbi:uncharacterized protein F4807DRAFT_462758 [Annulohypoxylon truncatum]|uniref:uncharacterized protein n=1 Tax=Annulohypoxylon truncatum TaxID=327061 RepID=UPI002007F1D4|nr:uncharacterized protein F4807DRAFT_462758 [Annulohypoxylon truncatum]KAI1207307.1 hypothetical protein F4807DRAFT_462758 [Annulohypoxylon truncatum]
MRHAQASRAAARAKALNLSVDTNVNTSHNSTVTVTQGPDSSTRGITAPATQHKPHNTDGKVKSSRPSQALANPNWRNRQLGPGAPLRSPTTAGLPQTEFEKSGGHVVKKPSRSVSPEDDYVVRGYRTTPIDPDFIHSAPLTKKDYRGAEIDSNRSEYDKDKYICPVDQQPRSSLDTGAPVRLEPLSPSTRERFEVQNLSLERRKENGKWVDNWHYGDSPLSAIPLPQTSPTDPEESMTFPAAKVKAIKESRRFKSGLWGDLDEQVQKQVAGLNQPRTAGHPLGRSRQEYENSRRPLAIASAAQGPMAQKSATDGRRHGASYPPAIPEDPEEENQRYESFIQKLNTPSDFCFTEGRHSTEQTRSTGPRSDTERNQNPTESKSLVLVHPPEKGESSVGTMAEMKNGKSLNPNATEFQFSGQASSRLSSSSNHNPQTSTSHESTRNQALVGNDTQVILDVISQLREEVAELKASSSLTSHSRDTSLLQQIDHLEGMANNLDSNSGFQPQNTQGQAQTALVHVPQPWPGHQGGAQQGVHQGSHTAAVPYSSMLQNQQYIPGMYNSPVVNGSVFNGPAYNATTYNGVVGYNGYGYNGPSNNGPGYNGSGYNGCGCNGPVYGSVGYAPAFPATPAYGPSGQPNMQFPAVPSTNPAALAGPVSSGNVPLHQQAQIAFGPKPVTKPRGPPRMNDPNFVKHQQDYEQYLEMKRSSDPEFARQCKDRQARRNERQRPSQSSQAYV